ARSTERIAWTSDRATTGFRDGEVPTRSDHHVSRDIVRRGQEHPDNRAMPDPAAGRAEGGAVQIPEHVAEFVCHTRWQRDRQSARDAGGCLPDPGDNRYESDFAQAEEGYGVPGRGSRQAASRL